MRALRLSPAGLFPGEDTPRTREALERFVVYDVTDKGEGFDRAYAPLWEEFGPRGEMERQEALRPLIGAPLEGEGLTLRYHLLTAVAPDGALAGVRDCWVVQTSERVVVYLAHTLVLPALRRSGLAALLRLAPICLAREGADPDTPLILAAEMEPFTPGDDASITRLISYQRAGFSVIPPSRLPHCQADFRDLAALGGAARPLPLLPVVRWVGHEAERVWSVEQAAAYTTSLYAAFSTHCREEDLAPARAHALGTLRGLDGPVRLLPLPTSAADAHALAPLTRDEVLRHYPEALRGPA